MSNSVSRLLVSVSAAAVCLTFANLAQAQDSVSPANPITSAEPQMASDAPQQAANEIVVTGSRIARSGFQAPTPVTTLGEAALQVRASVNVADALNELPAFRPSSTPSSSTQSVYTGANFVDLRGLGPSRTLVLVDGRRVVSSNISGNVDLNLIPVSLIQRTEIVTGGASAAYGSDAVAGVVNIILKRLDGFTAQAQNGITQLGDNRQFSASVGYGTGFSDGRGHVSIVGEFADVKGVRFQSSRSWYRDAGVFTFTPPGGSPRRMISENLRASNATFNGLINSGPLRGTEFQPGGGTRAFQYGSMVGSSYMVGGDGVNVSGLRPLSYPVKRGAIFIKPEFDISDALQVTSELSYSTVESGGESFVFPNNALTIRSDNAYLPQSVRTALAGAGASSFTMGRYIPEFGFFDARLKSDTYRALVAVKGDIGGSWKWDAYYQYGQNRQDTRTTGVQITANLTRALDAVVNPANGQIVCRSTLTAPSNGCEPLNLFGAGSPSAAAVSYVNGDGITAFQKIQQHVAAASVQGDLFSTWAGPVTLAAGAEYRRESVARTADPISTATGFNSANVVPIRGSVTVKEVFAELAVPLAKDMPFAYSLDLNGAVRFTDYSTSGSVRTWKIGGSYAPTPDIRFRGTLSRDIRAPNLGELFSGTTFQFFTAVDRLPGRVGTQTFSQQLATSNTALKPERSRMFTYGAVVTPSFIPGLSLAVDYYNIRIQDAIASLSAQQIIDRCYLNNQTALCPLITRDGTNAIASVNRTNLNLSSIKTSGVDFEGQYRFKIGKGDVTLGGLASYIDDLSTTDGIILSQQAGVVGPDFGSSPHWRVTGSATYDDGSFRGYVQGRWVGGGVYTKELPADALNDYHVKGQFLVNVSAEQRIIAGATTFSVFGTINNLFDKDPPLTPGTFAFAATTNQVLYDVFGRSFTVGARLKF